MAQQQKGLWEKYLRIFVYAMLYDSRHIVQSACCLDVCVCEYMMHIAHIESFERKIRSAYHI